MASELDDLKTQLEAAHKKAIDAMQAHADLVDKYVTARTDSFQPKVVEEARRISINPDNFETENDLQLAINRQLEEHPELNPDNNHKDETEE